MRWVEAARVGDVRQAVITDPGEARRAAEWARERERREERARRRAQARDDEDGEAMKRLLARLDGED